jgi:DNA-binding response OmpR family regulator
MESLGKILLVDDEQVITDRLAPYLSRAGYEVKVACTGQEALDQVDKYYPDLIILDVLMPVLDGREVLRQLRVQENWTPVIMLTQVGESNERTMALLEGADDYINKPFDSNELAARIKAVLRRASPNQPPLSVAEKLRCGSLVVDRVRQRAFLDGEEIELAPKAMALLCYMITHPDELLSRERLLDMVWGWDYPIGTRTVDTRIAELRKALGDTPQDPVYIDTIPGQGYCFIGKVEKTT